MCIHIYTYIKTETGFLITGVHRVCDFFTFKTNSGVNSGEK